MYLYGASGHAKVIIEILESQKVKIKGLFDDNPAIKSILDYPALGPYTEDKELDEEIIISIGINATRKMITEKFQFNYGKAIHPTSAISTRAKIDVGTVVMGNAIINSETIIGKHVIINTSASIDHDCVIDDFAHISPNATLCGGVYIGEGTHVGAGAILIPGVKAGRWVTIGAGAVIIHDIPDYASVVGNPGKVININSNLNG